VAAADAYIRRLQQLDEAGEQELLNTVLSKGFDQGCFLRPQENSLVPLDPAEVERVFLVLRDRPLARAVGDDPFPSGLDVAPVPGEEPGFVVLSQRCDLVSGFVAEPFVELARVLPIDARSEQARSARLNSTRSTALIEDETQLWVADLRIKTLIPKDVFAAYDAVNVVPRESRQRFRLKLGQRFSRDALPIDLVEKLQRPLIDVIGKNTTNRTLAAIFTDWLVIPDGGRFQLLAVVSSDYSQHEGDDAYHQLAARFPPDTDAMLTARSGAITMNNLSFLTWLVALKINLDVISWHPAKSTGQAEPTR
jgi:hypothetical protein